MMLDLIESQKKLFLDTHTLLSSFKNLHDRQQGIGSQADSFDLEKILNKNANFLTTSFILDRFFSFLARTTSYKFAAENAKKILSCSTDQLEIFRPDLLHELAAIRVFEQFKDFTDCITETMKYAEKNQPNIYSENLATNRSKPQLFIDTGPFLARYFTKDQHHKTAVHFWKEIQRQQIKCVTSNFVLHEFFNLARKQLTNPYNFTKLANDILNGHLDGLEILRPNSEDELAAAELFYINRDSKIGFTDCLSFTLMKKHGIKQAFTFDKHFQHAYHRQHSVYWSPKGASSLPFK